jgi:sodium/potassium-transporting ATPase subunit alpha
LTDAQVEEKLKKFGENALTEKATTPWYMMLLKEFTGFFSLLLIFGGCLCFIGYGMDQSHSDNLFLGCVLFCVVTITSVFSYSQESKAASLMAEFKNFTPATAKVIRNSKEISVQAKMLVPGDIVRITIGENVPADVILFEASELKVNNASLTGESEDIQKKPDAHKANVFESDNCVFFGTSCTSGNGLGMVFKTGDDTIMGRIAGLASSADAEETTLNRDIKKFIFIISSIAIALGITFFILGMAMGYELITGVIFAIGIIVANVPEGLLVTVTVALALTARRMSDKFVQVNNMESVETLGSTSCICSDKTGTLTQNRMTVSQLFMGGSITDASVNFEIYKIMKAKKERGDTVDLKEP